MHNNELLDAIKEAAKRSAWKRVLSSPHEDADAIVADPELLRLVWSEKDAKIMESYWQGGSATQEDNQAAMDRGRIPFGDFIDLFFKEKDKALRELRENV